MSEKQKPAQQRPMSRLAMLRTREKGEAREGAIILWNKAKSGVVNFGSELKEFFTADGYAKAKLIFWPDFSKTRELKKDLSEDKNRLVFTAFDDESLAEREALAEQDIKRSQGKRLGNRIGYSVSGLFVGFGVVKTLIMPSPASAITLLPARFAGTAIRGAKEETQKIKYRKRDIKEIQAVRDVVAKARELSGNPQEFDRKLTMIQEVNRQIIAQGPEKMGKVKPFRMTASMRPEQLVAFVTSPVAQKFIDDNYDPNLKVVGSMVTDISVRDLASDRPAREDGSHAPGVGVVSDPATRQLNEQGVTDMPEAGEQERPVAESESDQPARPRVVHTSPVDEEEEDLGENPFGRSRDSGASL